MYDLMVKDKKRDDPHEINNMLPSTQKSLSYSFELKYALSQSIFDAVSKDVEKMTDIMIELIIGGLLRERN